MLQKIFFALAGFPLLWALPILTLPRLQPTPWELCPDAAKVFKTFVDTNPFPAFNCMTFGAKKDLYSGGTKDKPNMEKHLEKWVTLRTDIINAFWECAPANGEQQRLVMHTIECPGSRSLTSDYDCSIKGFNPANEIPQLLAPLKWMFLDAGGLNCKNVPTDTPAEVVVETYFDSNFYGDLTYIPGDVFNMVSGLWTKNLAVSRSLFQLGSVNKKPCFFLARVCEENVMMNLVLTKIKNLEGKIDNKLERDHPPPFEEVMESLDTLYTKLKLIYPEYEVNEYNKGGDNSFDWKAIFIDLGDIAVKQTEAYLTYATIFDVVMRQQLGLQTVDFKPFQLPQLEEQCVEKVSFFEQIRFVMQHMVDDIPVKQLPSGPPHDDTVGAEDLMNFLRSTSKYWIRMTNPGGLCDEFFRMSPLIKANRNELALGSQEYVRYKFDFEKCLRYEPVGKPRTKLREAIVDRIIKPHGKLMSFRYNTSMISSF